MRHKIATAAVASVAAAGALQWLGRTYGSTADERRRALPGDELVEAPQVVTNHAKTIDAPPASVWPWLVQMGWGRGQWYTARWVDKLLFPRNGPSADVIVPELQNLKVGDKVLDGPPEANCSFTVEGLEENRYLVLHSREHLPPGWAQRGAGIDFTWTFMLDELPDGRARLQFRCRSRLWPWWVEAVYLAAMIPADYIMSRQMLRGIRRRAERTSGRSPRHAAACPPAGVPESRQCNPVTGHAFAGEHGAVEITGAHPVLAVHDLEISAAWYRDVLGCETREPDPGNWVFCRSGTTDFMLGRCPDTPTAWEIGDHSYVAYLHVDDVDAFHERAISAGVDIVKPLQDEPWGMREFGLRSPDGHRFMLGQPVVLQTGVR